VRGLSASSNCSNSVLVRLMAELAQLHLASSGGGSSGGDDGGSSGSAGGPQPVALASWLQHDGKLAAKVVVPWWMAEQLLNPKAGLPAWSQVQRMGTSPPASTAAA